MEQGESVVEGAVRELLEESCLNISWWNSFHQAGVFWFFFDKWCYIKDFHHLLIAHVEDMLEIGEINFKFIGDPVDLEVHVFQVLGHWPETIFFVNFTQGDKMGRNGKRDRRDATSVVG